MKNISFILLLSILIATGCSPVSIGPRQPSAITTDPTMFNAAIFYYDYSDVYISSVRNALSKALVQQGIAYNEFDAESSQSVQNAQIDSAIAAHVNLLIVNVVNSGSSDTSDAICLRAYRAGIPVIFFNRSIEADGDEGVILDYYDSVAFVGTDPAEAGHLQGEMIGNYLTKHFSKTDLNKDGQISYAMFKGEAKNVEAIYRTKYAVEDANTILSQNGRSPLFYFNPNTVDPFQLDLTGKWSLTSAQDYMMTNLSQYNEDNNSMIELVICNNDNMAEGCIRALQAIGYNLPKEKNSTVIPVFGVDATASARQLIAEGVMTGTVVQDADGMAECISLLASNVALGNDLLAGTEMYPYDVENDLPNKLYIPYAVYDPKQDKAQEDTEAEGSQLDEN